MVDDAIQAIALGGPTDFAGFRREARRLLALGVPPEQVDWQVRGARDAALFGPALDGGDSGDSASNAPIDERADDASNEVTAKASDDAASASISAPRTFVTLCERVVLHRDPSRFGLMYRLLWRFQREPALRHDVLDADRVRAENLARAVRRDMHKMTAFVRFRRIEDAEGGLHVAWFEPDHHIVEATAPFFTRRFTQMRWAILTPDRCVRWDGHELSLGPGAAREDAPPADAGEALWLTYYQHIFNPARLKLAMMRKEMPVRYWKNLPEAVLIAPLTARAAERSGTMIDREAVDTRRRLPMSSIHEIRTSPADEAALGPAASLGDIATAANRCRRCPIGALATQAVPGEGAANASLMFVGEQPGDQEDLRGRPFVGPAGRLFDRAIAQLGWTRDKVYVTNAVKHFKYELRGKRRIHKTPAQQEAAACLLWLEEEIRLVAPDAIVALGATAARSLMGRAVPVTAERGKWLQRADGLRVLITLHPSALLRLPDEEREAAFERWLIDLRVAEPHLQRA